MICSGMVKKIPIWSKTNFSYKCGARTAQCSYWTMGWKTFSSDCGNGKRFFSSPKCPHWFLDPPTFLFNGHQASLPRGNVATVWV